MRPTAKYRPLQTKAAHCGLLVDVGTRKRWQPSEARGQGVTNPTAFLAIALWTGVISAQPSTIGGANLFAPSWRAGKDADAERALPMIAFYKTPKSGTSAEPGALVRAEPATDFALPPGVTVTLDSVSHPKR